LLADRCLLTVTMDVQFEWERPGFNWHDHAARRPEGLLRIDPEMANLVTRSDVPTLLSLVEIYESSSLDGDLEFHIFVCMILFANTLKLFPIDDSVETLHLEIRADIAQGWLGRANDSAMKLLENTHRQHEDYHYRLEVSRFIRMMSNQKKDMENE
jgi:hypothetical protein